MSADLTQQWPDWLKHTRWRVVRAPYGWSAKQPNCHPATCRCQKFYTHHEAITYATQEATK